MYIYILYKNVNHSLLKERIYSLMQVTPGMQGISILSYKNRNHNETKYIYMWYWYWCNSPPCDASHGINYSYTRCATKKFPSLKLISQKALKKFQSNFCIVKRKG